MPQSPTQTAAMPVLFVGHGSPMNILADNTYTQALEALQKSLPKPQAILSISAHWVTSKTLIQSTLHPKTVYDFGGFPEALYQVQYSLKGSPELATRVAQLTEGKAIPADSWGIDHGTWSVLRHLYPEGEIPVTQLSLNANLNYREHYALAQKLIPLRSEGILILGSGNIVHNLREVDWAENSLTPGWAQQFDASVQKSLDTRAWEELLDPIHSFGASSFQRAHPSIEHYLPLLYSLGAAGDGSNLRYFYEGFQNATISMRSCIFYSD